jgi:valyl-tRNA synthetase
MSNAQNPPQKSDADSNPDLAKLAKSYEPAPIEAFWGPEWEKRGIAEASLEDGKEDFCIQLPLARSIWDTHLIKPSWMVWYAMLVC